MGGDDRIVGSALSATRRDPPSGSEQLVRVGVGSPHEDLMGQKSASHEPAKIVRLRARRDHHIVGIGHDENAQVRTLHDLPGERDRIERILVAGGILAAPEFGKPAAHRHERRGKHRASDIGALRQQRRRGVPTLGVSDQMQATIAVLGLDGVECG